MSGTFVETFWRDIIAKYPTWMLDTVGMFIWHEAIYFGAAIPFIIMDTIPALRKYKIQPVRCACRPSSCEAADSGSLC